MSTTTLTISSYPSTEDGLVFVTNAIAWDYSDWEPIAKVTSQNINIQSLIFQIATVLSADTTYEVLFEIGVNYGTGIVTKIQLPISVRNDTAVGFYPTTNQIFLPEPYSIMAGASIYVRVAGSANSVKTFQGVKLIYQSVSVNKSELYQGVSNNYQAIEVGNGMSTTERIR